MGHLYSKVKPNVNRNKNSNNVRSASGNNYVMSIKIDSYDVKIDNKPTQIDEKSSTVLKYRTPHFRAKATVIFPPIGKGECWKVGWIQACTQMEFLNTYGNLGYSSWEFPELSNGQKPMVSDSDGRNFPWYGSRSEVSIVKGPQITHTTHTVSMNDNFYPHVTWDIPTSNEKISRLTNIKRNQTFFTWLVAMDVVNTQFVVLKTFKWKMNLEIWVDPYKELGQRARLISAPQQHQPTALKENIKIPNCALYPSNANSCQVLMWRPSGAGPVVVVGPRCINLNNINKKNKRFKNQNMYNSLME